MLMSPDTSLFVEGVHCTDEDEEKRNLMLKKGIYPYEYMNDFARFEETALPPQEEFYSKLSGKGITEKRVRTRAKRVEKVWMSQSWRLS